MFRKQPPNQLEERLAHMEFMKLKGMRYPWRNAHQAPTILPVAPHCHRTYGRPSIIFQGIYSRLDRLVTALLIQVNSALASCD